MDALSFMQQLSVCPPPIKIGLLKLDINSNLIWEYMIFFFIVIFIIVNFFDDNFFDLRASAIVDVPANVGLACRASARDVRHWVGRGGCGRPQRM